MPYSFVYIFMFYVMLICGLDWADPRYTQLADACECGNEPSGYVKCGEFLD